MRFVKTRLIVLPVVLLSLICHSVSVHGYGTATHSTLSAAAYGVALNILSNFFQALGLDEQRLFNVSSSSSSENYTALQWLAQGSIREDEEPLPNQPWLGGESLRSMFHFFDPVHNIGLSGLVLVTPPISVSGTTPSAVWGLIGTGATTVCGSQPCEGFSATNDFAYASARADYVNGLTCQNLAINGLPCTLAQRDQEFGLMFRSLGQVIHLLQDAAQPQHVRNDPHTEVPITGNPSVYEHYVDATYANESIPGTPYSPPSFPLPSNFFANGLGQGIAEFTNNNFVSFGTNCTSDQLAPNSCNAVGGYQSPMISSISGPVTLVNAVYGGNTAQCQSELGDLATVFLNLCSTDFLSYFAQNQVQDAFAPGTSRLNPYMSTYSIFAKDLKASGQNTIFSLNRFNYGQQASLLLPRAVGYSGGLLNYFFRGSMTAQGDPSAFTITNTTMNGVTPETMNGTFSLYYDDQNGNRQMVSGASWSLSIAGGATSSGLTFTPPTNPAPAHSGQYTLVFQGTMGAEDGAVAGTLVQLQPSNLTLTVVIDGEGSGRVTSVPGGINCSGRQTRCSASFPTGTQVTLTAVPDSGSTFGSFGSWSCFSPNPPPLPNPLSFKLVRDVNCTAIFGIAPAASILTLSCDQIGQIVDFSQVVQATGTLRGPIGFGARIDVGPSPFNPNIYTFLSEQLTAFDCGAWSADPVRLTCTRSNSQPLETTWATTLTSQWLSNFPNPPPLSAGASVHDQGGTVLLASQGIGCTIK